MGRAPGVSGSLTRLFQALGTDIPLAGASGPLQPQCPDLSGLAGAQTEGIRDPLPRSAAVPGGPDQIPFQHVQLDAGLFHPGERCQRILRRHLRCFPAGPGLGERVRAHRPHHRQRVHVVPAVAIAVFQVGGQQPPAPAGASRGPWSWVSAFH